MARILVADDDSNVRFMLRIILEREGYTVTEASNGSEALDLMREAIPDLVITDYVMPVMGGEELIERMRSDPSLQRLPVLGITAHRSPDAEADITVVDKPFAPAVLVDAVTSLLARRRES